MYGPHSLCKCTSFLMFLAMMELDACYVCYDDKICPIKGTVHPKNYLFTLKPVFQLTMKDNRVQNNTGQFDIHQKKHWGIFLRKKNNKTFQTGLGEHSLCLFKISVLISVHQGCYKTFTYRFINTGPRYCIIMDRLQKSNFKPKCSFAHNILTGMNSCYKCIF